MQGGRGRGGGDVPEVRAGYVCSGASCLTLGWHGQLCGHLEMHGCPLCLAPAALLSARYAGVLGWLKDPVGEPKRVERSGCQTPADCCYSVAT